MNKIKVITNSEIVIVIKGIRQLEQRMGNLVIIEQLEKFLKISHQKLIKVLLFLEKEGLVRVVKNNQFVIFAEKYREK